MCPDIYRSSRPHLELITHHVTQPLVIHNAKEDINLEMPAVNTTIHGLSAIVGIPGPFQQLPIIIDSRLSLLKLERCRVMASSVQGARLGRHELNHHSDCHS